MTEQGCRVVCRAALSRGVSVLVLSAMVACARGGEQQPAESPPVPQYDGPRCEVHPPAHSTFEPELEWAWTGSTSMPAYNQVVMTPVVVEVNGDGVPDVVFNTFNPGVFSPGVMRAVSGRDGREIWSITDHLVSGIVNIAAGDLDGDGKVELCTIPSDHLGIICFENTGQFKFRTYVPDLSGDIGAWGGPSMADLEGDGRVEIIMGNHVFDPAGRLLWQGEDGIGGIPLYSAGPISFAADIDQDGRLEVVNDRAVYRHDGTLRCRNTSIGHGLAGVGNFDSDPKGEIVVVWSGRVSLLDDDCSLRWTTDIPGGGNGGAPNIADFDQDSQPEIGVAGAGYYTVLETNGTLKWWSPTQDASSHSTGSSTFDFEGDGRAEVVYADEVRLRIYDGATGAVRVELPHSSATAFENPVIADVDGDDNAELIVASNDYYIAGTTGMRVYRDRRDTWVNTRRIWNQHAYSVTNVNEDGTIPARPATNWLTPGLNTFRSNSQGVGGSHPFAAPDLVATEVRATCIPATQQVTLSARVRNQGDAAASAGMKVAFFRGNPAAGGTLLGVATLPSVLTAGAETQASLVLDAPADGLTPVWAVADDDGMGTGREAECREDNNITSASVNLSCQTDPRWVQGPSLVGCHTKLYHHSVLLPDGRVFATGGYSTSNDIYDPMTGTWSATTPSARPRRFHSTTLLGNGKVLVAGGAEGRLDASAELFDPSSETWTATGRMGTARRDHTATLLPDGRVLVAGGGGRGQGHTAEVYDPARGAWSTTGRLNVSRRQHTATLLANGRVLVTGGVDDAGRRLVSSEWYDPATGQWSVVGNLLKARAFHTATALPDGRSLVSGGIGDGDTTAEIFDSRTRSWAFTGRMSQPRRYHAATLLRNGKVLVTGGYDEFTGIHASAELYDVATGQWSATAPMWVERYHLATTLLRDGRVLAVGGFSPVDQGATELYEP